jgi:glycerate 2-kinase
MKKCIVIPDSFKGSLSSIEICSLSKNSISKYYPDCEIILLPVADGGEGTVDCFLTAMQGEKIITKVHGPYMEEIAACYGKFGKMAVIEMAQAAGLPMVCGHPNPALTTTYGVGELIAHAVNNGANEIILGLGGSATNDAGCGCAAAMGVRFLDTDGNEFVPVGATLEKIVSVETTKAKKFLKECKITVMCDIDNPMHGENGAAFIFGPQKGADGAMVRELDRQLVCLDHTIQRTLHIKVSEIPGSGAAGAMGAGMVAFFGAELKSGIETVLDAVGFDEKVNGADAVFTGEGKIDSQSLRGKVVIGVARRAKRRNVPVYAVVGDVADDAYLAYDMGVTAIFSINRLAISFSEAKARSAKDYVHTFEDILRLMKSL